MANSNYSSQQSVMGSMNAVANGDHAQASVQIIERAELNVSPEIIRALIREQLLQDSQPEIHETFRIVTNSEGVQPTFRGNSTGNAFEIPYVPSRQTGNVQESLLARLHERRAILI